MNPNDFIILHNTDDCKSPLLVNINTIMYVSKAVSNSGHIYSKVKFRDDYEYVTESAEEIYDMIQSAKMVDQKN